MVWGLGFNFRRWWLEDFARELPVKTRKRIGIILLSGGVILSIIGLVPMFLFQGESSGFGGIGLIGLFFTFFSGVWDFVPWGRLAAWDMFIGSF